MPLTLQKNVNQKNKIEQTRNKGNEKKAQKQKKPVDLPVPNLEWEFLYDHQRKAVEIFDNLITQHGRGISVLVNMPTGAGKTMTFSYLLSRVCKAKKRVLVLTHTKNLLDQTKQNLKKNAGIIATSNKKSFLRFPEKYHALCLNVQAFDKMPAEMMQQIADSVDFVAVDECHHYTAASYIQTINFFRNQKRFPVAGFSATPRRTDNVPLNIIFDYLISSKDTRCVMGMLFAKKKLSPYQVYSVQANKDPDFSLDSFEEEIGESEHHEYSKKAISHYEAQIDLQQVIDKIEEYLSNKQTIVFCASIAMSKALAKALNERGYSAVHVDGGGGKKKKKTNSENSGDDSSEDSDDSEEKAMNDTQRREAFEGFESGKYQFLLNCSLISEGFDVPKAEGLILLKPTKSVISFLQMVGRVLRYIDGKIATILDFCDAFDTHGRPEDEKNNNWREYFSEGGSHQCEACDKYFLPSRDEIKKYEEVAEKLASGTVKRFKIYRYKCPHCDHMMEKKVEIKSSTGGSGGSGGEEKEKKDLTLKKNKSTLRFEYLPEVYAIADEVSSQSNSQTKLALFDKAINQSKLAAEFSIDECLQMIEFSEFDYETEKLALGKFLRLRVNFCEEYLDFMRFIGSSYSSELREKLWHSMPADVKADVSDMHKAYVHILVTKLMAANTHDEYKEIAAESLKDIPSERRSNTKRGVWVNFIRTLTEETRKSKSKNERDNLWKWAENVIYPFDPIKFQKLKLDVWSAFSQQTKDKLKQLT